MAKGSVAVKQPGFTTFKAGEYKIIIPGVAKTNIELIKRRAAKAPNVKAAALVVIKTFKQRGVLSQLQTHGFKVNGIEFNI